MGIQTDLGVDQQSALDFPYPNRNLAVTREKNLVLKNNTKKRLKENDSFS